MIDITQVQDVELRKLNFDSVVIRGQVVPFSDIYGLFETYEVTLGMINDLFDQMIFTETQTKYNGEVTGDRLLVAILDKIRHSSSSATKQSKYSSILKIEGSLGIHNSSDVKNSEAVTDSVKVSDSKYVSRSGNVSHSKDVVGSLIVDKSYDVLNSSQVKGSQIVHHSKAVHDSTMVRASSRVESSEAVIDSMNVRDSVLVIGSNSVVKCLGIYNCIDISNAIFCSNLDRGRYMIGNVSVDKEIFDYFLPMIQPIIERYVNEKLLKDFVLDAHPRIKAHSLSDQLDIFLLNRLRTVLAPILTDEMEKGIMSFFLTGGESSEE